MARTQTIKRRNRAAQDATLINMRALEKRIAVLERKMKVVEYQAGEAHIHTMKIGGR